SSSPFTSGELSTFPGQVHHARGGFAKDLDHLVPAPLGETREITQLPLARLVDSRDASVDGGALSQLNLPENLPRKPLICAGSVLSKADFC
ncbi:hypothetical protein, partial [Sphingomonas sp. CFBP 8760]|uniref:hypothetical protein n=1 Tax=Sphingomonas sp. CFBP 8760 TaxID=2775282 RepID=UPI00406C985F